jgi:hypothetical protein
MSLSTLVRGTLTAGLTQPKTPEFRSDLEYHVYLIKVLLGRNLSTKFSFVRLIELQHQLSAAVLAPRNGSYRISDGVRQQWSQMHQHFEEDIASFEKTAAGVDATCRGFTQAKAEVYFKRCYGLTPELIKLLLAGKLTLGDVLRHRPEVFIPPHVRHALR